jgi:two-component system, OmpR family, response regulator
MVKKNIKILLAEDDKNLGDILTTYLEAKGYTTTLCVNGEDAYQAFLHDNFNLLILDVMMPMKDGFALAREIRKKDKNVPMLFLTAKSMHDDVLRGFQLGADDYITKPFSMEVLLVRMNAILRRTRQPGRQNQKSTVFGIGEFVFDYARHTLTHKGSEQKLTSKEADLLHLLCEHANEVLDRSKALKEIWHDDSYFNARSMDVYVTKLRKFLKQDPDVELINVHGIGFKLVCKIDTE